MAFVWFLSWYLFTPLICSFLGMSHGEDHFMWWSFFFLHVWGVWNLPSEICFWNPCPDSNCFSVTHLRPVIEGQRPFQPQGLEVPSSRSFEVVLTIKWPQGGSISSCTTLAFSVLCFLVFIFCSSRVDSRCVCLKCTGTWFSYAWTDLYSLSGSFPILVLSVCSVDLPVLFRYFGLSIW